MTCWFFELKSSIQAKPIRSAEKKRCVCVCVLNGLEYLHLIPEFAHFSVRLFDLLDIVWHPVLKSTKRVKFKFCTYDCKRNMHTKNTYQTLGSLCNGQLVQFMHSMQRTQTSRTISFLGNLLISPRTLRNCMGNYLERLEQQQQQQQPKSPATIRRHVTRNNMNRYRFDKFCFCRSTEHFPNPQGKLYKLLHN